MQRKNIQVAAAVIIRTVYTAEKRAVRSVFSAQRGYGAWKGWWEFPGGKIEAGETPEDALVREIREEFETEIRIEQNIATVEYDYPEFHLCMHCFVCTVVAGNLSLLEHTNAAWLTAADVHSVSWLPADERILERVKMELLETNAAP